eukprot:CAMPEP_0181291648 /NCGR_PEP_ID=MMETSP1101-20121128/2080_1 /TAXON_ID=46948 /ORGANISM="Rhodomonas abbreviata, Strain Caron Lab Isolate" /LENGTH=273 /DNA_ID=CAMNT_0023396055 /DNA_START=3 /DNA_END=824 /DNA_ORIENTATION=-
MMVSRPIAVATAALGLAAALLAVTTVSFSSESASTSALLEIDGNPRRGWQDVEMLRLHSHGNYWGNFDCHNHLHWDYECRDGGCYDTLSCGTDTPQCVKLFKSCLLLNHPASAAPRPADCWCFHDIIELGCAPECADSIFRSYGQLSWRCYGFSVYQECYGMFKDQAEYKALQQGGGEQGGEQQAEAPVEAQGESEVSTNPPPVVEARAPTTRLVFLEDGTEADPALQFRQPAGTYVQHDESATLIEPWQYNSHFYDPREADPPPFDDDDPRE